MQKQTKMQQAFEAAVEKNSAGAMLRHPTRAASASAAAMTRQVEAALNRRRFNLKLGA